MKGETENNRNYVAGDNISVQLWHGDAVESLKRLPDNSIDSVVADPPYGLSDDTRIDYKKVLRAWLNDEEPEVEVNGGLAGITWDSFVPSPAVWKQCLRVLKPGGYLLSFAGSRTQDLMCMSIRLAGFKIRQQIAWVNTGRLSLYSSIHNSSGDERHRNMFIGFRDLLEPITVAQKPAGMSASESAARFGTGGLYFEDALIPFTEEEAERVQKDRIRKESLDYSNVEDKYRYIASFGVHVKRKQSQKTIIGALGDGRMTQNIIFSHDADCVLPENSEGRVLLKDRTSDCVRDCPVSEMTTKEKNRSAIMAVSEDDVSMAEKYNSFYFHSKTPPHERPSSIDSDTGETVVHNTVKPLALMRWLVRLATPEGGVVLDPFVGSGTTLEAAVLEGKHSIGVEMTADYIELIDQRMKRQNARVDTDGIRLSERVPLKNKKQSEKTGENRSVFDLFEEEDGRVLAA